MNRRKACNEITRAFLDDIHAYHYLYTLQCETGIHSGQLIPILDRMIDNGWIATGWTKEDNRYYEVTEFGKQILPTIWWQEQLPPVRQWPLSIAVFSGTAIMLYLATLLLMKWWS